MEDNQATKEGSKNYQPTNKKLIQRAIAWKQFVWIIFVKEKDEESKIYTGFCIDKNGTIMTTFIDPEVEVWASDVDGVERKLSWLGGKRSWGISVYKIASIDDASDMAFPFVKLAHGCTGGKGHMYKVGEKVISIRHPSLDLAYSILVGRLRYGISYNPSKPLDSSDENTILEWRRSHETLEPTPPELVEDLWKQFVWIIFVKEKDEESKIYTGFCIDKNGTIMTTFIDPEVEVWASDVDGVERKLSWLGGKRSWGISVYKIASIDDASDMAFPFVKLAHGCTGGKGHMYKVGEKVISILHPSLDLAYSILVGRLRYGISYNPSKPLDSSDENTILEWRRSHETLEPTPPELVEDLTCRTALTCLAHVIDTGDHLNPDLPVIQLDNLLGCVEKGIHQGAEGGPVFNADGNVIGMISFFAHEQDFAIHADILAQFYSELLAYLEMLKMSQGTSSEDEDEWMEFRGTTNDG